MDESLDVPDDLLDLDYVNADLDFFDENGYSGIFSFEDSDTESVSGSGETTNNEELEQNERYYDDPLVDDDALTEAPEYGKHLLPPAVLEVPLGTFYTIRHQFFTRVNKRFSVQEDTADVRFHDFPEFTIAALYAPFMKRLFDGVIGEMKAFHDVKDHHLVNIVLSHPDLRHSISTGIKPAARLNGSHLMEEIQRLMHSDKALEIIGEKLKITMQIVRVPCGGARNRQTQYLDKDERRMKSASVVTIVTYPTLDPDRYLCTARALVVGISKHENSLREYISIKNSKNSKSYDLAVELHDDADVEHQPCSLEQITKFQDFLAPRGYQIVLVDEDNCNEIIYCEKSAPKQLGLLKRGEHFDAIVSLSGWLKKDAFCTVCKAAINNRKFHKCFRACYRCGGTRCRAVPAVRDKRKCGFCLRYFSNDLCFEEHFKNRTKDSRSVCQAFKRCVTCYRFLDPPMPLEACRPHCCEKFKCSSCNDYVSPPHKCYMKTGEFQESVSKRYPRRNATLKITDDEIPAAGVQEHRYFYHDTETINDGPGKGQSPVFWGVVDDEGNKVGTFQGRNCAKEFCSWMYRPQMQGSTFISHVGSRFDHYFVLKILEENNVLPRVICRGSSIISIQIPKYDIRFIDSYNFLSMKLRNLPRALELPAGMEKGQFPFKFIQEKNFESTDDMPGLEYFDIPSNPQEKQDFLDWYEREAALKKKSYCFWEEIERYCIQDCEVLRLCLQKFQAKWVVATGLDPFVDSTLAGACMSFYQYRCLEPDSIALINPGGFNLNQKQSKKAFDYFTFVEDSSHLKLRTARSPGGEFRVNGVPVDAYDEENRVVYQFHGDYFNGCPEHTSPDSVNKINGKKMSELYRNTLCVKDRISKSPLVDRVKEMWECQWDKLVRHDPVAQDVHGETVTPADPRLGLQGGSTDLTRFCCKVEPGQQIRCLDVCSLYPYVQCSKRFFKGHPTIITSCFTSIKDYFGLIKCKMLASSDLFHPVLNLKIRSRLIATLCYSCAKENNQTGACEHDENARALIGEWYSPELELALDEGYTCLQIFEVHHFPESCQYNATTGTPGLFTEYFKVAMKGKVCNSGFPAEVKTEAEKVAYCEKWTKDVGFDLQPDEITDNTTMRVVYKLMCNNLWGRMALRDDLSKTVYVKNSLEFYRLLTDSEKIVQNLRICTENLMSVTFKPNYPAYSSDPRSNIYIAGLVTAYGRVHLYSAKKLLGQRCLYYDTDGVYYLWEPGVLEPERGLFLGNWNAETSDACFGIHFQANAPKFYQMLRSNGTSIAHVKGISLTNGNKEVITMESMEHVRKDNGSIVTDMPNSFKRNLRTLQITNHPLRRVLRNTYSKRFAVPDSDGAVPFGFKGNIDY